MFVAHSAYMEFTAQLHSECQLSGPALLRIAPVSVLAAPTPCSPELPTGCCYEVCCAAATEEEGVPAQMGLGLRPVASLSLSSPLLQPGIPDLTCLPQGPAMCLALSWV